MLTCNPWKSSGVSEILPAEGKRNYYSTRARVDLHTDKPIEEPIIRQMFVRFRKQCNCDYLQIHWTKSKLDVHLILWTHCGLWTPNNQQTLLLEYSKKCFTQLSKILIYLLTFLRAIFVFCPCNWFLLVLVHVIDFFLSQLREITNPVFFDTKTDFKVQPKLSGGFSCLELPKSRDVMVPLVENLYLVKIQWHTKYVKRREIKFWNTVVNKSNLCNAYYISCIRCIYLCKCI